MEKVHAKKTWCKWKNCALKVTTGARLVGSAHGGSFPTCLIPRKNARLNAPHESHLGGPWRLVACWGHSPCGSLGLLHPALLSLRFNFAAKPQRVTEQSPPPLRFPLKPAGHCTSKSVRLLKHLEMGIAKPGGGKTWFLLFSYWILYRDFLVRLVWLRGDFVVNSDLDSKSDSTCTCRCAYILLGSVPQFPSCKMRMAFLQL